MNRYLQLARLNARVANLALRGHWLGPKEVGTSYNRVASTYEEVWLCHLRRATDELLQKLPSDLTGTILDLGSGTGYSAKHLAGTNPISKVIAVDISEEMLKHAQAHSPVNMNCSVSDMLPFVQSQADGSVCMIVSTWAIGYSHPTHLFRECSRLLPQGGKLAFIVNYADTLSPIFRAFQRCMLQFPNRVRMAAYPRFPKDWSFLQRALSKNQFEVVWHRDGKQMIAPPAGPLLPWLRQTGILAGFDSMLDFSTPVGEFFEAETARSKDNLFHHFAMVIATRK
ncbi:MAG: methyltransferase domain-containing protein [Verrucomicrobiota bacterium]